MPVGPKGEKRPSDPYAAGIMAAKVLLREIPEEYVTTPEPAPNRAKGALPVKSFLPEKSSVCPKNGSKSYF